MGAMVQGILVAVSILAGILLLGAVAVIGWGLGVLYLWIEGSGEDKDSGAHKHDSD